MPDPKQQLWVTWITTGKGQIEDSGAVVGTEWVCRKKASQWLRAAEVKTVSLAPLGEIVTGQLPEPPVIWSDDEKF